VKLLSSVSFNHRHDPSYQDNRPQNTSQTIPAGIAIDPQQNTDDGPEKGGLKGVKPHKPIALKGLGHQEENWEQDTCYVAATAKYGLFLCV
jgi:hypothetical protein